MNWNIAGLWCAIASHDWGPIFAPSRWMIELYKFDADSKMKICKRCGTPREIINLPENYRELNSGDEREAGRV